MIFSPLTVKRFRSFRRIKRAWYALIAFVAVFVFCMCADFVAPYSPTQIVDPATLEAYRKPVEAKVCETVTARFTVYGDGEIADFEGPEAVGASIAPAGAEAWRDGGEWKAPSRDGSPSVAYRVHATAKAGRTRVFLEPVEPERETVKTELPPVAFPFRPIPTHPFGIDDGGRDVFARVVHGMRIELLFGLGLALMGMFVGLVVGAIEGYFGGKTDIVAQRITEIWSAIPFLYVMIFIGTTVGQSLGVLFACYAVFNWIAVSYYMRAEFLRLRMRTFVEAAKVQGFSALRIIFCHILPNALTPLITLFPFLLMGAIGSLAALDFLGFGVPPMYPSCGELLKQAHQIRNAWWLSFFPAAALFVVMLLAVLVGEGLRDAFDPRQRSKLE